MSRTTGRWSCWVKGCEYETTAAGRYRHLLGHFNRGEITREWVFDRDDYRGGYWSFRSWKKGERDEQVIE